MTTRVIPWPLPTIPGQATNKNPGGETPGGGDVVEYVNLSGMKAVGTVWGRYAGSEDHIETKKDPITIKISDVDVLDVTGLSVIATIEWKEVTATGVPNTISFVIDSVGKKNYSVGANINREINLFGVYKIMYNGGGEPVETSGGDFRRSQKLTDDGGTVTIKVVNAQGLVLQTGSATFPISVGVRNQ